MSRFYVTTPIYYVNDLPHIGHTYTTIVADTVARWRRLRGDDVRFLTGTDEHGQKIEQAAAAQGVAPIALADRVVDRYHQLWQRLGLTHDDFIRTTEARHARGVRAIIERIAANGDFYVARHEGWYCVRCEAYYTEKELLEGNLCPIHHTPCEWRSEENVFFRLSRYQDQLLELYDRHPDFIRPATRRNEVRQFVADGLKDLSVSRTNLDWGIPFPGHDDHTVYVWLDALTNYISALGLGAADDTLYRKFWDADDATVVQLVGKDILRFHGVFWPAFLMSAKLPLPETVWAHGWWLVDDRKMSKSSGRVARADHLIEDLGGDAVRYYLLREMVFGQDASWSDEGVVERFNSDLANDLGNSTSRLVTLSRRAFDGHLPPRPDAESEAALQALADEVLTEFRRAMDDFAFRDALRSLWRLLQAISQHLVQHEPWKLLKDPDQRPQVAAILWPALEALRLVATALLPILPETAPKVLGALRAPVPSVFTQDDRGALAWGGLASGAELPEVAPLFPRIDKDAYLKTLQEPAMAEAETETPESEASTASEKTSPEADVEPAEPKIDIDRFFEVVLKVAEVREATKVAKSNKLLKLTVDLGEPETRTVVAGIAKAYAPEDLVGRQVVVVANLAPARLMGVESNGMVLAATQDGRPVLLSPETKVAPGTRVS
ncbi:MAG: methionine--tRNA ligase [Acidobacteriota bacterium]